MQETRQQRRARLRQVRQLGEGLLRRGFPRKPTSSDLGAASLALADRLDAQAGERSPTAFAAAAHALYEATLEANPPAASLACRKGCNWCCYSTVAATAPEILLVWSAANDHAPTAADAAAGAKLPCMMLRDGVCSIYLSRPLMCRVANSLDWTICREEYEGTNPERDVPISRVPVDHGIAVRVAVLAALRRKALDSRLYELGSAIAECSTSPDVAARWLRGEPAFQAATVLPTDGFVLALVDKILAAHAA